MCLLQGERVAQRTAEETETLNQTGDTSLADVAMQDCHWHAMLSQPSSASNAPSRASGRAKAVSGGEMPGAPIPRIMADSQAIGCSRPDDGHSQPATPSVARIRVRSAQQISH